MMLKVAVPILLIVLAAVIWLLARPQDSGESIGNSSSSAGTEHSAVIDNGEDPMTIKLVDPEATAATRSLFAYLQAVRGEQILFGHQHATTQAISVDGEPIQSEVRISTGDYPAVFGWDTLSMEGREKPGIGGNVELSRDKLIEKMQEARRLGGIIALSTHPSNFVTGGNFNDTSAAAVEHILPGGSHHAEFNTYLDHIAYVANNLKDDDGEPIPVLFRPFHEQNGSWFWWGASLTKTSDYIALYRYTVDYLRDTRGVRNFLYVYSPNGPFNGDEGQYLTTYPGDAYVDILGMDQYDNIERPGSKRFLDGLTADLSMINRLADQKGKIAALSEFGYSPQGMKTEGNGELQWFTKLLSAITADPDAKRTAYMQTWANFALNGNLFVPYRKAPVLGDHELLPDFIAFYEDPYTAFAGDLAEVYSRAAEAGEKEPLLYIAAPTDGTKLDPGEIIVRARVHDADPAAVELNVLDSGQVLPMTESSDGYYTAVWTPEDNQAGRSVNLAVQAAIDGGDVLEDRVQITIGTGRPPASETLYSFEEQLDDWAINNDNGGAWNTAKAEGPELSDEAAAHGSLSLKASLSLGGGSFELARIGDQDWRDVQAVTAKLNAVLGEGAEPGGGIRAKLFLKTGDGWAWTDSGETVLTPGMFTELKFDLSNVTGKEAVRAVGVQILSTPESSGTAAVLLDEVTVWK